MSDSEWKFWTAIAVAILSGAIAYWKGARDQRFQLKLFERQSQEKRDAAEQALKDRIAVLEKEQHLSEQQVLKAQLKKYSGLILLAAADLQDRLWHLTRRQAKSEKPVLLNENPQQPSYPAWPMTRNHYLTGTVYLFARYWCWIEVLSHTIRYLDFGSEEQTKAFRDIVKRTERALAETELQKAASKRIRTDRPIFQMQQALMGQCLIRGEGEALECMNFASFAQAYPDLRVRHPDFQDLEALLTGAMTPADSDFHLHRLKIFANSLVAVIDALDPDGNLIPPKERETIPNSGVKPARIREILAGTDAD